MILTFKYRLLPTRKQHAALNSILESQRQLYNAALQERIDAYQRSLLERDRGLREKPRTITYFDQTNSLTQCRQEAGLGDVPAFLQHWTLRRLDDAYKAFFSRIRGKARKPGFPRFRGRDYWRSFGFSQDGGFRLGGARCRVGFKGLPAYDSGKLTAAGNIPGGIRLHLDRPAPKRESIRAIVLTRDPGGRKWYISIQCECEPRQRCQSRTAAIGIDVGIAAAIAQSDGGKVNIPTSMTRSAKGTAEDPGTNVRAKAGLNREMLSVGFAGLASKLAYKAARDGARLITIDPRYTSQACSECGSIVPNALDQRIHSCDCGYVADRDHNAARNILFAALAGSESAGLPPGGDRNASVGLRGLGHTDGGSRPDGAGYPAHLVSKQRGPPLRPKPGVRIARKR